MSGCTFGNAFALSSLVIVSESGVVLCSLTALPSLNAGREIFHVVSGTYSRLVPQTPEKNCGTNCGTKPAMRRRGANFLREFGAPGAIPTRDLPLRRRTLYAAELREH